MARRFVIIGGGPAGNVAASHATRLGAEVTLIENDIVPQGGGDGLRLVEGRNDGEAATGVLGQGDLSS